MTRTQPDSEISAPVNADPALKIIPPHLEKLSWMMDKAIPIPGTSIRFGFDSLLGLLPGIGDFVGLIISAWVVTGAVQAGARRPTVFKMLGNIAKDALLGTIPFIGDIFDVASRANVANMELLQKDLDAQNNAAEKAGWRQRVLLWGLIAGCVAVLSLALYGAAQLIRQLI